MTSSVCQPHVFCFRVTIRVVLCFALNGPTLVTKKDPDLSLGGPKGNLFPRTKPPQPLAIGSLSRLRSAWREANAGIRCRRARRPLLRFGSGALGDLVDGVHFFDVVTDDVVNEVLYDVPGWPRVIKGRTDLMAAFKGYVENIALQSADNLIVHRTDDGAVVVIEYEVRGTILATGVKYNNRFCSVIKIENRRITHWRDYMDCLAAWNALTAAMPRLHEVGADVADA